MKFFFCVIVSILACGACKTIQCREYHRRYTKCVTGTNRPKLDEFDKWVDWCEHAPEELLQLDCLSKSRCDEFLHCIEHTN